MIPDILCTVPLDRATFYQLKPQSLQLYITYIEDKLPRKTTVTKVTVTYGRQSSVLTVSKTAIPREESEDCCSYLRV